MLIYLCVWHLIATLDSDYKYTARKTLNDNYHHNQMLFSTRQLTNLNRIEQLTTSLVGCFN